MAYFTRVNGDAQPVFALDVQNGPLSPTSNIAANGPVQPAGPKLEFFSLTANATLIAQGGVNGRTEATGRGVFFGVREAVNDVDLMKSLGLTTGLGDKTVIVQGFGNVGYYAAKFIQEGGATITGIIEWDGAVYNADGIDVNALKAHHAQTGSIRNFAGAQTIDAGNTVLEYPCDILVPAALESQITHCRRCKWPNSGFCRTNTACQEYLGHP